MESIIERVGFSQTISMLNRSEREYEARSAQIFSRHWLISKFLFVCYSDQTCHALLFAVYLMRPN